MNSLQALFSVFPRALKTPYRKYREVMRAFRRKPLFVQRKSILVLTLEVRKLHMDKITSQARTNLSIALQILIGSMSDGETERKSEIYICI